MRRKIQRSMVFVIVATLLISYVLLTVVFYQRTVEIVEEETRQEADYICKAIEISGAGYLEQLDAVRKSTRITWVDENGNVLYDSKQGEGKLENHAARPEIRSALESGSGQVIRQSDTVGEEMLYYASRLPDGTVLRVSKSIDSAFHSAVGIFPIVVGLMAVMILFAWLFSRKQAERLIRPINHMDLRDPLANDVYEELSPLLQRLDRQNKEKDAIDTMRREFTANVSHELKTPLTSISGYAEIMMNGLVKPGDIEGFARRIYDEASRLVALIEDTIMLSRLDEGKVELEKEDVNLYSLTREICSRLAPQAASRDIRVEVIGEEVVYSGIKRILDEMIYNICENAIKYNKPGGKVTVWVGETLNGKKVIVKDTGIGIPKDQQERVFERFYRVDKSHSRESGGTGLGLSIVKHGALLHDAAIHLESEAGEGTKIELIF